MKIIKGDPLRVQTDLAVILHAHTEELNVLLATKGPENAIKIYSDLPKCASVLSQ